MRSVRSVITGLDQSGKSVFVGDEVVESAEPATMLLVFIGARFDERRLGEHKIER
jgi:hypothetical protein